jgi:hypothetical protein
MIIDDTDVPGDENAAIGSAAGTAAAAISTSSYAERR